jgi:hypothetical protein
MKQYYFAFILLVLIGCGQKKDAANVIHNKDFGWTITIPDKFESVPPAEWEKLKSKGQDAFEKTYDTSVAMNAVKSIFVFKSDEVNYFESNYQSFDTAVDGSYDESFNGVNNLLYGIFESQIPGAVMDTASSRETIGGLEFHVFHIKMSLADKLNMNFWMFSRLFGKFEFTVNILAADKAKEKALMDAWKNSVFEKKTGS